MKLALKPNAKKLGIIGASVGALAILSSYVAQFEGLRTNAYQDVVGVWTVCYGETNGVHKGDHVSPEVCQQQLEYRLQDFEIQLDKCIVSPATTPVKVKVAVVSWAYNVGIGAACKSKLIKSLNAGHYQTACDALMDWDKVRKHGKLVPNAALHKRRVQERRICMEGIGA